MKSSRGFTLIELTVVICIVAVLFYAALDRLFRYQELGERAALQLNLAAVNTALALRFAAYVTMGKPEAIEQEAIRNPIAFLARPPQNYLGELFAPDVGQLPRQSWYFDARSSELVYVPQRARHLRSGPGQPEALRFKIIFTPAENEPGKPRVLSQPLIVPEPPFTWEIE
jgi:prepilin-type N-terminal cleavage/methylation domain-containing protein